MPDRSNPFTALERTMERLSRQFEEAARSWEYGGQLERPGFESMAVDVADRDETFVVTVDVPGFDSEEIDVHVTDRTLHITAEHEAESEERDENYLRKERRHRSLERSVRLPEGVDADGITATLENGVLTVSVPKSEPREKGHRIEIE